MRGRWFAGWIVVGALGALTVLGALSIGIFVLPFFGLSFAYVARHTRYPLDVLGGLVGIGVVLFVIAYVNSDYRVCPDPPAAAVWIPSRGSSQARRSWLPASPPT